MAHLLIYHLTLNKSFLDDLEQASPALQVPVCLSEHEELGNMTWKVLSSCDYLTLRLVSNSF